MMTEDFTASEPRRRPVWCQTIFAGFPQYLREKCVWAGRATTLCAAMTETHLTAAAHQRLQEELTWRSGPRRLEISEMIERAREHGDLRENADYDA
ncbi:MAG: hypothetical protein ACOYN3_01255, partial [Acidimicrobiia bacterium]